MRDLAGKVAVVTGGAGGIGKARCEELVAEGTKVVVTDVQEQLLRETIKNDTFVLMMGVESMGPALTGRAEFLARGECPPHKPNPMLWDAVQPQKVPVGV